MLMFHSQITRNYVGTRKSGFASEESKGETESMKKGKGMDPAALPVPSLGTAILMSSLHLYLHPNLSGMY